MEIASIEHFFSLLTGKKICARKASEKRRFPGLGKLRSPESDGLIKNTLLEHKKARIFPAGERGRSEGGSV